MALHPIPTLADSKETKVEWKVYQTRQPTRQELHQWWPVNRRKRDHNLALVLGPGANLLVLNANRKNGVDGVATLKRRGLVVLPTPTILTPSDGLAYCFKLPDRQRYPSPFCTYIYPPGYEGLEFRGSGGYQLIPPSRVNGKPYQFVRPWTLERLRDLADLPDWLLKAWLALDAAEAAQLPSQRPKARLHPAKTSSAPTPDTSTITTVLSADEINETADVDTLLHCTADGRVIHDGIDLYEQECAEVLCLQMDLSVDALGSGQPFLCPLPGHREMEPSASWLRTESGHYLWRDWHRRSGHEYFTVPEIFASLTSRVVGPLPNPSRMVWRLRLMVEQGWLAPEPVRMPPVPEGVSNDVRRYCEGFRLLVACKSCHPKTVPQAATPFSRSFAARWCGIPNGSVWAAHQEAMRRDLIVFAGLQRGQPLYRPGKDE
jgi:hypothetical protein